MTISQSLSAYLATVSGVTDLVGSAIYPVRGMQGVDAPPDEFVTYSFERTYERDLGGRVSTEVATIRAWAFDYDQAHEIADALDTALEGFTGLMGGGVTVEHFLATRRTDGFADAASDVVYFIVTLTFDVLYR